MAGGHLICPCCRIRVLAAAPAIDLLEARCPICEGELRIASGASSAVGFRLFDLDPFAEAESQQFRAASTADLLSRRDAATGARPAGPSPGPS